ncbi:MAG TPA: hypothetical protein VGK30_15430 [Candidatus Binatia bacterium]|jgi:hypothetical protein
MDGWRRHRYETAHSKWWGDVGVVSEEHTDRAAEAARSRQPLSLARRCAILALGGTVLLIEVSGQMIARSLETWGAMLERARARLLGGPESEP